MSGRRTDFFISHAGREPPRRVRRLPGLSGGGSLSRHRRPHCGLRRDPRASPAPQLLGRTHVGGTTLAPTTACAFHGVPEGDLRDTLPAGLTMMVVIVSRPGDPLPVRAFVSVDAWQQQCCGESSAWVRKFTGTGTEQGRERAGSPRYWSWSGRTQLHTRRTTTVPLTSSIPSSSCTAWSDQSAL